MPKRHDNRGRSTRQARFVKLEHWMLRTEAWRDLSVTARALYVELASRYAGEGTNNGRIGLGIRDAAHALKVSKSTASAAFDELEAHGFIACERQSGFSVKSRIAREWRLTEFPSDLDGSLASKDFTRWASEKQNTVPLGGLCVPPAGQYGPSRRTVDRGNSPDGPSRRTVSA